MGTTTNYGFRFPELTDAPNGPLGFSNLANDLDAEFVRRGIVGRNVRTTNLTGITTITRVLSVTAPVVSGRTYRVTFRAEAYATAASAVSQHELRYTTNNTEPLVSSPILNRAVMVHPTVVSTPDFLAIEGLFVATATGTLRVALTSSRAAGSGTVAVAASADAPGFLTIEDLGPTKTVTGTVY